MRGLRKYIKEIKAYLQDNMKAGMCWDEENLKRKNNLESFDIKSTVG